ncbi:MAG: DUF3788 domain-containing protein [Defluviitaleaceae bacterium]|nr:DUF3788 domain-containing protein [Defluviitaleaceae bacterium]
MRPTKPYSEVKAMLGNASAAWEALVGYVRFYYEMDENWAEGKPTHKHFNNLFIKRSGKALLSLHLRDGFFLVGVTLGGKERDAFEAQRAAFGETVRNEYDAAETLHDGKWLGFEVRDDSLIDDIIRLLQVKRKPNRKALPKDMKMCGRLDIGMAHDEITRCIMA